MCERINYSRDSIQCTAMSSYWSPEADPGGGGLGVATPPLSYMVTPPLLLNSPSPFPAFCIGLEAPDSTPPPPPPLFVSGLKWKAHPPPIPPPPPHLVSRVSTPPLGKPCIRPWSRYCCDPFKHHRRLIYSHFRVVPASLHDCRTPISLATKWSRSLLQLSKSNT